MKTIAIRLICLCTLMLPIMATAQTNIKSAFDEIIQCKDAQITDSHTLDRDPATHVKTGQSDVYRFELPVSKMQLVENAVKAFQKDSEMAYSFKKGKAFDTDHDIVLAVGNEKNDGVLINDYDYDYEYIYALFLAPQSEDATGNFRYAYAMNYKESDGKLIGKLVITYAPTLKYRQEQQQEQQFSMLRRLSSDNSSVFSASAVSEQKSWFETLMSYFQSMTQANSQTRIALATKAFKLISNMSAYDDVTNQDKEAVREVLKGMIADEKYSETVLNKLLNQCLAGIK